MKLYLKCQPVGWIRGSNPRVGRIFLAGQGDPTRGHDPYLTGQSEYHGSGRVGSFSSLTGRVGSGQLVFKSRGSGRVRRFSNITGWVGSGQEVIKISRSARLRSRHLIFFAGRVGSDPTRPVTFDLAREQPWTMECRYRANLQFAVCDGLLGNLIITWSSGALAQQRSIMPVWYHGNQCV